MPMASTLHFAVLAAAVSCALLIVPSASVSVFKVGGDRGWAVPANGAETYNHWAKKHRFEVGDLLTFKYANDSVLLVTHDGYKQCSTEAPLRRFSSGDTEVTLHRYGPLYFVSGVAGHCEAGQRMIVRVTARSALYGAPAKAPAVAAVGLPPSVGGRPGAAPSPVPVSSAAAPAVPAFGSASASSSPSPSPSPSPMAQSGVASGRVLGVVSSVAVGIVVSVITMSVMA